MNIQTPATSPPVVRVAGVADLSRFLQPSCAAAIWERRTPKVVQAWLDALDPARLPRGRVVIPAGAVPATLGHLCDIADLPQGPERRWLEADIAELAQGFTGLMGAPYVRLRLDVVTGNACRKFHLDALTARLVCTYRGTGTQYGVAHGDGDPAPIHTVPTGAPILLRGSLWPTEPAAGLLHRSPPIEGTGEARLVLVLDPVEELPPDAGLLR